jgi:hypothetical protein
MGRPTPTPAGHWASTESDGLAGARVNAPMQSPNLRCHSICAVGACMRAHRPDPCLSEYSTAKWGDQRRPLPGIGHPPNGATNADPCRALGIRRMGRPTPTPTGYWAFTGSDGLVGARVNAPLQCPNLRCHSICAEGACMRAHLPGSDWFCSSGIPGVDSNHSLHHPRRNRSVSAAHRPPQYSLNFF